MSSSPISRSLTWIPGFILASGVAFVASFVAQWIGEHLLGFSRSPISDIMMAIILGMIIANTLTLHDSIRKGLQFCATTVLRIGIMLLGIRLSFFSAGKFTLVALPFVIISIVSALVTMRFLGRLMGLSPQLTGLIAVGTSICGTTAIVATAPLLKAKQTEVSYAIACITIFGLIAMFLYPFLAHFLFSDNPIMAGLFLGTSIHETAQVAGAGLMYQAQYNDPAALDIATITKLVRNLSMIAVIPAIGIIFSEKDQNQGPKSKFAWLAMIPWFIVGFGIMSAIRSIGDLGETPFGLMTTTQWDQAVDMTKTIAEKLLLIAMSAVGLTSLLKGMREVGLKPFLLALFAATLVGIVSIFGIFLLAGNLLTLLNVL